MRNVILVPIDEYKEHKEKMRGLLYKTLLVFGLIIRTVLAYGQSAACPEVFFSGMTGDPAVVDIPCAAPVQCASFTTEFPDTRGTVNAANAYIVNAIPFSGNYGFNIGGTAVSANSDDIYSPIINLPFNFCYYGTTYNQCVIGSNGVISFNVSYAGGSDGYQIGTNGNPVPNPVIAGNNHLNSIFVCFHDINPLITPNGGIKWQILGSEPCRKLVVNWYDIPNFSCNNLRATFQCVLYENTNVIEVYVRQKPTCTGWQSGYALIGIQNATGTQGIAPPGRNRAIWTTTTSNSEAWQFIPNGASLLQSVALYDANTNALVETGVPSSAGPGMLQADFSQACITSSNPNPAEYYVKADYISCTGTNFSDSSFITVTATVVDVAENVNVCAEQLPYMWRGQSLTTSGIYYDTIDVLAACDTAITLTFNVAPIVINAPSVTDVSCYGDSNGVINSVATGGMGVLNYVWTPVQAGTGIISGLPVGDYSVTVTDNNACSVTASYTVSQPDSISFPNPSVTNVNCFGGNSGAISSEGVGGTGTLDYTWTPSDYTSVTLPNSGTVAGLTAQTYMVTVTDDFGCTASASYTVTQRPQMLFSNVSVTNVSCNGEMDGRIISPASGGSPDYTYSWSHNLYLNSAVADNLPADIYTQTVTDYYGCTAANTITITEPTAISVQMSAAMEPCSKEPSGIITSTASGGNNGYQYALMRSAVVIDVNATGIFTSLPADDYGMRVTDSSGCLATGSINVPARIIDMFDASVTNTSCYGSEYQDGAITIIPLSVNTPYQYSIDGGTTFVSDSVFSALAKGNYTIIARSVFGCDTSFILTVNEPSLGTATIFPNDTSIEIGETITLNAYISPYNQNSIVGYHWSSSEGLSCDDCANPTFSSYQRDNKYELTITYNDHCTATTSASVTVFGEPAAYIPNAFSPNGDGNNDYFEVLGKMISHVDMKIFNRWGEKVYDSQGNAAARWDGTYNGAQLPSMNYTYIIEVEYINSKKTRKTGSLVLIR